MLVHIYGNWCFLNWIFGHLSIFGALGIFEGVLCWTRKGPLCFVDHMTAYGIGPNFTYKME
jgi:hypothetical protein